MYLKLKENINIKDIKKEIFVNCPHGFTNKHISVFSCYDCEHKKCMAVCKNKAIYFSSNNIVAIDENLCDGCGKCVEACDKKAIFIINKKARKCDLCSNNSFLMPCYYNNKDILEIFEETKTKQKIYSKYLGYKINRDIKIIKTISKNKKIVLCDDNIKRYVVKEPFLSLQEIDIINTILDTYKNKIIDPDLEEKDFEKKVYQDLETELINHCYFNNIVLDDDQFNYILNLTYNNLYNYGPISYLLENKDLEEISVIGINKPIYVYHKNFGWLETNIVYISEEILKELINKLSWYSNKYITLKNPLLDSTLNAIISPITESSTITIRMFSKKGFSLEDLLKLNTLSLDALAFLSLVFLTDSNVLVVGNTGSGKTTTLNALLTLIPKQERFVLVEEVQEIKTPHKQQVSTIVNKELDVTLEKLVINTLRMRPDRVVIGEIRRREECFALIDSMLCGQAKGTYTTFHAQSVNEAILRLVSYGVLETDLSSIDIIINQRRYNRYTKKEIQERRNIFEISEIYYKDNKICQNKLFEYDTEKDKLLAKNKPKKIIEKFKIAFNIKDTKGYTRILGQKKKELAKKYRIT
jgi:archaeal flagellar protein FlaI